MVECLNYIVNSRGVKAFVGDKVCLDLYVQGWIGKNEVLEISEIRPDGTVILDKNIGQHISGMKDFKLISKRKQ